MDTRQVDELRAKTTLGSFIECGEQRPDLAELMQQQIDMALRQASRDGKLRWVCLLQWAGANPRSRGAIAPEDINDPEMFTSALEPAGGSQVFW